MIRRKLACSVFVLSSLVFNQQAFAFSGAIAGEIATAVGKKGADNIAVDVTGKLSSKVISDILGKLSTKVDNTTYRSVSEVLEDGALGLIVKEKWNYFEVKALLRGVFDADETIYKVDSSLVDTSDQFFDDKLIPRMQVIMNSVPDSFATLPQEVQKRYLKQGPDGEYFNPSAADLENLLARTDLDPNLKIELEDALRIRTAMDNHDFDSSLFSFLKAECKLQ